MSLWDDLDRREQDVLQSLENLDRQRDPFLALLADIRVAKAALRPSEMPLFQGNQDDRAVSFYRGLTLKQLAIRALRDHFPEGATAQQLLDFFERAYGRQIERSSLSPQLSRLKDEGDLALVGKHWRLPAPEREEPPTLPGGGSSVREGREPSQIGNSSPPAEVEL